MHGRYVVDVGAMLQDITLSTRGHHASTSALARVWVKLNVLTIHSNVSLNVDGREYLDAIWLNRWVSISD